MKGVKGKKKISNHKIVETNARISEQRMDGVPASR